jgi:hypothetical protein
MAPGGDFAVAFQNADLDEVEFDVKLALFNAAGDPIEEYALNTHTASEQREANVVAVGAQGYVTVWSSLHQDGDGDGVYARRFMGPQATDSEEFAVPESPVGWQNGPVVGANAEIIVVVWQQTNAIGDYELQIRVMDVSRTR